MPTYLLTVRDDDLLVVPGAREVGLRLSEFRDRPGLATVVPGAWVELVCPDGLCRKVRLKEISLPPDGHLGPDGTLYDFGNNPRLMFSVSPPLKDALAPVGTELWLVDKITGDDHDGGRVPGPGPQPP